VLLEPVLNGLMLTGESPGVEDEVPIPTEANAGGSGWSVGAGGGGAGMALFTASVKFQLASSNCRMATSKSSIPVQA